MGTPTTGHGELRSDDARGGDDVKPCLIEPPRVTITSRARVTHGGHADTEPCGKCGCEFVNVGCPKHWPVETVALTCAKCGSVVEYVDGLLLITVKEYLREYVAGRAFVSGEGGVAIDRSTTIPSFGLLREMVLMGKENALSTQDIAEALEVSEEYVELIAATERR